MSIPRWPWEVRPSAFQAAPLLAASLLALLLASPHARAQAPAAPPASEPPLRVIWISDDPQCDGGDVASHALRLVSSGVVPRPLKATVEVQREGNGWLVRLQTESADQSGRRILRAESCKELEQAIALLLAMTMESKGEPPAALPEPPPAAANPPPGPNADGDDGPDEPPPPPPPPSPGLELGVFARVTGKVGWGLQPGTAFGVGANIGMSIGDVDVGIDAAYWPGTRETAPELDDASVVVTRYDIGLRACWNVWHAGDLVVAPCLGPGLTYYRYDTEGISTVNEDPEYPLLLNVTGSADIRYAPFGPHLSLVLSGGLTWEKVQPFRTGIDDPTAPEDAEPQEPSYVEIYRTKGLGPRLELGVDARF